ncbi:unnamed protein product [Dicrocoelium dendriticum]|nr:unnamed protein product [Dicrocoelium dendriticum]
MGSNLQQHITAIESDSRTVRQLHNDFLHNLLSKHHQTHKTLLHLKHNSLADNAAELRKQGNLDWDGEVDRWIFFSLNDLNGFLLSAEQQLFTLLPDSSALSLGHSASAIIQQMEHQLKSLRSFSDDVQPKLLQLGSSLATLSLHERQDRDALDYLRNAYEIGENNKLFFWVGFDVRGFNRNQLHLSSSKNQLTLQAKSKHNSHSSTEHFDFSRTVFLPNAVQWDQLHSRLSSDGILLVKAPVNVSDHHQFASTNDAHLALKAQLKGSFSLKATGSTGLSQLKDSSSGSKLHLELPLEAGFSGEDLFAHLSVNHLILSGRKQLAESSGSSHSTNFKQFSHSFKTSETLDLLSLKFEVQGNTVLLEAPLLKSN